MSLVAVLGLVLTLLIAVVTILPLSGSKQWWVRVWDFPRLQIAAVIPVAMVLAAFGREAAVLLPILAVCLAYQLWRIRPYTPFARSEITFADGRDPDRDVVLLSSNVLMENRDHHRLVALIERVDPDVLFLMETDATWIEALEPALARYRTVIRQPRDDCYGLVFATRLEPASARAIRIANDDTPAVFAEMTAPGNGRRFRFVGLHPRPPMPGQDTDERDEQVLYSARFAHRSGTPIVAAGDFNDVAWSDTSQRFKFAGGYLDPRIGRGLYASFHADRWPIRFPIDQLFVSPDVAMIAFGCGPNIGSDHFPIVATVRIDPDLAVRLNRPPKPLAGQARDDVEARAARHRDRLRGRGEDPFPDA